MKYPYKIYQIKQHEPSLLNNHLPKLTRLQEERYLRGGHGYGKMQVHRWRQSSKLCSEYFSLVHNVKLEFFMYDKRVQVQKH